MAKKKKYPFTEGKYYSIYTPDGTTYDKFEFINENKGYFYDVITDIHGGEEWKNSRKCKFEIIENILKMDFEYMITEYEIFEDMLIPTKYSFDGNVPYDDRFKAICTYNNDKVYFYENGTVIHEFVDNKNIEHCHRGVYVRMDNIIVLHMKSEDDVYDECFGIYKNRLNDSILVSEVLFLEILNIVKAINLQEINYGKKQ